MRTYVQEITFDYNLPIFRLTIPLALVIGFNITLTQYFRTEAWYTQYNKYAGYGCANDWWHTILYIANLTGKKGCLGQTWYLWADMQMFFMSPLIILPMFYWQKNFFGLKLWLFIMMFFSAVPLSITLVNGLPPYGLM